MAGYTISDYLLDRLAELGADRIFGVPGDFTLTLLDHVIAHPGLDWVGCTNELNAGYAADGYARMRGIGALLTTFGVGELSAINAMTGSFAEHVPVLHVVGAPSSGAQATQRIVHHSLGDGVFTHFMTMHEQITCAHAALTADNAATEIDRVLVAVRDARLPGYLLLPSDVGELPATPPAQPLVPPVDQSDPLALAAFRAAAERLISTAADSGQIGVLAGLLVHRFGAADALNALLRLGTPHATSAWSKSLVDESNPAFLGLYAGALSSPGVHERIEQAPVLIVAGIQFTDLNSGFFTQRIPRERTIELGAESVSVGGETFGPIGIGTALTELADVVATRPRGATAPTLPAVDPVPPSPDAALSQQTLWDGVAGFLRAGDVVLADQGTSFYGMATQRLPGGVTFLGQPLWASIGYSVPALLGAVLGAPERRGVLLVGDGAAQMTAQELSTLLRLQIPAVVLVVDNDGYTVERAIHGANETYNDIARWDWAALPAVLGGTSARGVKVATVGELAQALADAAAHPDRFTLVQAVVPRDDVPHLLADLARTAAAANAPAANAPATASSP